VADAGLDADGGRDAGGRDEGGGPAEAVAGLASRLAAGDGRGVGCGVLPSAALVPWPPPRPTTVPRPTRTPPAATTSMRRRPTSAAGLRLSGISVGHPVPGDRRPSSSPIMTIKADLRLYRNTGKSVSPCAPPSPAARTAPWTRRCQAGGRRAGSRAPAARARLITAGTAPVFLASRIRI
jgi:hypothetical protein